MPMTGCSVERRRSPRFAAPADTVLGNAAHDGVIAGVVGMWSAVRGAGGKRMWRLRRRPASPVRRLVEAAGIRSTSVGDASESAACVTVAYRASSRSADVMASVAAVTEELAADEANHELVLGCWRTCKISHHTASRSSVLRRSSSRCSGRGAWSTGTRWQRSGYRLPSGVSALRRLLSPVSRSCRCRTSSYERSCGPAIGVCLRARAWISPTPCGTSRQEATPSPATVTSWLPSTRLGPN